MRRFLADFPDKTIAIISVDPSKRKYRRRAARRSHPHERDRRPARVHALAGDAAVEPRAVASTCASRSTICSAAGFDLVIVETSGIGQSDTEITEHADVSLYVMTAEYGAATQLEKIDMLDFADVVAINKFDKRGSLDALRDVRKQYQRNHKLVGRRRRELPVFGTIASQFNDPGMNRLLLATLRGDRPEDRRARCGSQRDARAHPADARSSRIIPAERTRYLAEIVESSEGYDVRRRAGGDRAADVPAARHHRAAPSRDVAGRAGGAGARASTGVVQVEQTDRRGTGMARRARGRSRRARGAARRPSAASCSPSGRRWSRATRRRVPVPGPRQGDRAGPLHRVALAPAHPQGQPAALRGLGRPPDLAAPRERRPGMFPFTAGVFPLKREGEDPARMFAGEGGPERTNRRFHYVSRGMPAKRLSTAFDSVTLYGEDPARRPDIYGKVGNSGVCVATVDDAKKLYSGFDLCDPSTSVSMTINGPAPMLLASS